MMDMEKIEIRFLVPKYIIVPANRWQSIKQAYFPRWMRKLFPVKTREREFAALLRQAAAKLGQEL